MDCGNSFIFPQVVSPWNQTFRVFNSEFSPFIQRPGFRSSTPKNKNRATEDQALKGYLHLIRKLQRCFFLKRKDGYLSHNRLFKEWTPTHQQIHKLFLSTWTLNNHLIQSYHSWWMLRFKVTEGTGPGLFTLEDITGNEAPNVFFSSLDVEVATPVFAVGRPVWMWWICTFVFWCWCCGFC